MPKKYLFCLSALSLFIFSFLFPAFCQAAVLYLEPDSGQYKPGESLIMEVRIDTQGKCVNVVKAKLSFPNEVLILEDFSIGDSILNYWIDRPATKDIAKINQEGSLSFSGGIPGGYCGRVPGDPLLTNILGKLIFKVPGMIVKENLEDWTEVEIIADSKVFLHDGLGTEDEVYTQGAKIMITQTPTSEEDEWQKRIGEDTIPPEPFSVEVQQNPRILEGKSFLVFWTVDRQTGIDHFEVQEGTGEFKQVKSPYLLKDQDLGSKIVVKAVDKAGNERITEYIPEGYVPEAETLVQEKSFSWWIPALGVLLLIIGLVLTLDSKIPSWMMKRYSSKESDESKEEET